MLMKTIALLFVVDASILGRLLVDAESDRTPCHGHEIKSLSSDCEVITLPKGFCGSFDFGPTLTTTGAYIDCTRTVDWKTSDKASIRNGAMNEYILQNPCDVPRHMAFSNFMNGTTGDDVEIARLQLDFFVYAFCEAACDCIPQVDANRDDPRVVLERGNCQKHPQSDICQQTPGIKLIRLEGSLEDDEDVTNLPRVCDLLDQWDASEGKDFSLKAQTWVDDNVRYFLARMIDATQILEDIKFWNQCYTAELSQRRISETSNFTDDYEGCWIDQQTERAMEYRAPGEFSIEDCIGHCGNANFAFAGVEYFDECFCGNDEYNKHGLASSEEECNTACAIGPGICGGVDRVGVYKTHFKDFSGNYEGCWIDQASDRAMEYQGQGKFSIEECIDHCGNANFTFAGVEYFDECFCGNEYTKHGPAASDDECNTACFVGYGICGGYDRLGVYAI
ncbi:hypothetical protein ACA910_008405 [Epithemia clementina (nom. ined.)]